MFELTWGDERGQEKWNVLFTFVLARNHKLHYPIRDSDGIPTGTTLLTASIDSLVPIDLSLILEIMSAILESVRAFFSKNLPDRKAGLKHNTGDSSWSQDRENEGFRPYAYKSQCTETKVKICEYKNKWQAKYNWLWNHRGICEAWYDAIQERPWAKCGREIRVTVRVI